MGKRDWIVLTQDYYEDPVIEAIADEQPLVFALWPYLIARCAAVSHVTRNPTAALEIRVKRIANDLRADMKDVQECLRLLDEGECIGLNILNNSVIITINRFDKYQVVKGSKSAYKRDERYFAGKKGVSVDKRGKSGDHSKSKSKSKNKDQDQVLLSVNAKTEVVEKKKEAMEVFNHWAAATYRGKGRRPEATTGRLAAIEARLKQKWTVAELKQAIDGFAGDPFYNGDNGRGKRYLEIRTRLGSTEQVEKGIELATSQSRITDKHASSPYATVHHYAKDDTVEGETS